MSKVSKETKKPVQALLNAVATSKLRLVRLLIEGGVHVDCRNDRGQTPLLMTCSSINSTCHTRGETRERVVKYLISAGADVNTHDVTGRTPLIYAVITRASVIFDLIDAGADPWKEDCSRKCAFDYALQNRDIVQVEIMVDACKRSKIRGIVRDVGGTRGIVRDTGETRNTRDVTDTPRDSHEHIKDTLHGKKDKKLSLKSSRNKPESAKKPKVHPKNRKRFTKSRNTSTPTFKKNSTDISFENPKRARQPVHHPTTDKTGNVETFCKSPSFVTSHHPSDLQESTSNNSTNSHNIPQVRENSLLCDLCKTIFYEQRHNETEILNPSLVEDLNFPEYDLSELLYRRRSTGNLFGLGGKRYDSCESIRKKRGLGMTMEDLFSNTEINQPEKHPLSTRELLVPDRTRSASVSLPLNDTRRHVEHHMFCSRDAFPFITSAKSVPQLHTMAWSRAGSPDFTPESSVYLGSDDECDDIIMIPASCRSMTSSPILDMTSPIRSRTSSPIRSMTSSPIPDMTSSTIRSRTSSPIRSMTSSPDYDCRSQRDMSPYNKPPSAFCDESEACNSLIPTIVLTDCINTDHRAKK